MHFDKFNMKREIRGGVVVELKESKEVSFFRKQMSLENKTKERNELKYNSRQNICEKCFTTKSLKTGECLC